MGTDINTNHLKSQDNVSLIKRYIELYKSYTGLDAAVESKNEKVESDYKKDITKNTKKRFEVVFSSVLDTIIEKKLAKESFQIVLMPSQDKYILKQESKIQELTSMQVEDFNRIFVSMKPNEPLQVNNKVFGTIYKSDMKSIYYMITLFPELLSEGMMSLNLFKSMTEDNDYNQMPVVNKNYQKLIENKRLFKYITLKTPILDNVNKYDEQFILFALSVDEILGYDSARLFIDDFVKSSMQKIAYNTIPYRTVYTDIQFKKMLDTKYRLNPKRLFEYLCFDLYSQGFFSIDTSLYNDYLQMSYAFNGKILNKYPKALHTEHDKMALAIKESDIIQNILKQESVNQELEITGKGFHVAYKKFKEEYEIIHDTFFEYKGMSAIIPNKANELISEGIALGHCVAAYIKMVYDEECLIVFVRKKDEPDKSYLTVELKINHLANDKTNKYFISQIQGDFKRTDLSQDEIEFFNRLIAKFQFGCQGKFLGQG